MLIRQSAQRLQHLNSLELSSFGFAQFGFGFGVGVWVRFIKWKRASIFRLACSVSIVSSTLCTSMCVSLSPSPPRLLVKSCLSLACANWVFLVRDCRTARGERPSRGPRLIAALHACHSVLLQFLIDMSCTLAALSVLIWIRQCGV